MGRTDGDARRMSGSCINLVFGSGIQALTVSWLPGTAEVWFFSYVMYGSWYSIVLGVQ